MEHTVSYFLAVFNLSNRQDEQSRQHEHVVIPFIGAAKICICHSYTDRSFPYSLFSPKAVCLLSYDPAPGLSTI